MLIALTLSAFSVTTLADDNATSGDGDTHGALSGCGWYNTYQYMWKITVFVGKSDTVTKASNLNSDFYRIGTVIMKKTGWTVPSGTQFASGIKIDYYGGSSLGYASSVNIISDSSCPEIPIVCGGNISTIKQYFGSTGTMNTILNAIAADRGTTAYGLLASRTFTIGGQSKSGWDSEYLLPNGTENRVPWVIVYEPMVIIHCKDKTTKLAFTATECAIAQLNGWYQWSLGDGSGQGISRLTSCHLPTSVQLEDSWFGYPVYTVTNDSQVWSDTDIIKGGGWGMRWLPVSIYEEPEQETETSIDYGVSFSSVNTPSSNSYGSVSLYWKNYKDIEASVLCELYLDEECILSEEKFFSADQGISQTVNIYYSGDSPRTLTAKINYENRNIESDPNDNIATQNITPDSNEDDSEEIENIDYGCTITMDNPEADSYGSLYVTWRNWTETEGEVLCEIYCGSELLFSEYKDFDSYEVINSEYTVYFEGSYARTLTAKINYENRASEIDPNDNRSSKTIAPTVVTDSTYDFSVSHLYVEPDPVEQGANCTVDFLSANWNVDRTYYNILVEVLVNDVVVKTEVMAYSPLCSNYHFYSIPMTESGTNTVTARINWSRRTAESNAYNNSVSKIVEVGSSYDFSVSNLTVTPSSVYEEDTVTITFSTESWDKNNTHENIPIEILYDGKVIHTEYSDYTIYGGNMHTIKLNVGSGIGTKPIEARINWNDRTNESDSSNNKSDTAYITVKPKIDLSIEAITPNSNYKEGTTVITSYTMYNNSGTDIIPSHNNTVQFEAYYYNGSQKVLISTQAWNKAVIPAWNSNLVYFKWTVPKGLSGKQVYCKATVNADYSIVESNQTNNSDTLIQTIAELEESQTPDTQYEASGPSGFTIPSTPATKSGSTTWNIWEYISGKFIKKSYGITIDTSAPKIEPDKDCPSAIYTNNTWIMKSGYGITVSYMPAVTNKSGYIMPDSSAYTTVQRVYATFPEFKYSVSKSNYRTLEYVNNKWCFEENCYADENDRLHFTPLWYPNGRYNVSVTATEVWTPSGMIEAKRNSNTITITDAAYDDWFVGRE